MTLIHSAGVFHDFQTSKSSQDMGTMLIKIIKFNFSNIEFLFLLQLIFRLFYATYKKLLAVRYYSLFSLFCYNLPGTSLV